MPSLEDGPGTDADADANVEAGAVARLDAAVSDVAEKTSERLLPLAKTSLMHVLAMVARSAAPLRELGVGWTGAHLPLFRRCATRAVAARLGSDPAASEVAVALFALGLRSYRRSTVASPLPMPPALANSLGGQSSVHSGGGGGGGGGNRGGGDVAGGGGADAHLDVLVRLLDEIPHLGTLRDVDGAAWAQLSLGCLALLYGLLGGPLPVVLEDVSVINGGGGGGGPGGCDVEVKVTRRVDDWAFEEAAQKHGFVQCPFIHPF